MSETEAVCLAQSGDSSAFDFLYNLHRNNVFRRCMQMLHNEDEAKDLTQEVFLLLWQKINLYGGGSNFKTWLYRLTTNKVLCYLRYKKSRPPNGAGDSPEMFEQPTQHKQLEIMEALENLSDMQKICVEAELEGNSLRGFGANVYLRTAQHSLRGQLA
jgi:RNA polymerase sigma factor (sigma-70 family)